MVAFFDELLHEDGAIVDLVVAGGHVEDRVVCTVDVTAQTLLDLEGEFVIESSGKLLDFLGVGVLDRHEHVQHGRLLLKGVVFDFGNYLLGHGDVPVEYA
ncbi:hypothetical protein D3C78_1052790 [compost metagenome]